MLVYIMDIPHSERVDFLVFLSRETFVVSLSTPWKAILAIIRSKSEWHMA